MPVKESKKTGTTNPEEMETKCAFCAQKLDLPTYFCHAKEVHGVFTCLYCLQYFKFSQELMVHLTREHKVVSQKFSSGPEFLERGGGDTTLLCVECNKVFPSDALVTYMKSHVTECRKSTGICPKCGSIQALRSLGEHILQCQGSKNVNLIGSTTITTSQLRNRDNSCKYCGKKFSPSKIAAHMRACSVRSTKSTINVWNSNRTDVIPTGSGSSVSIEPYDDHDEKVDSSVVLKSPSPAQKSTGSRRNSAVRFESLLKSNEILFPKSKKLGRSDSLPLPKPDGSKKSDLVSPQPPKLKRSDSLAPPTLIRTSPKKETTVTSIKSIKPALKRKSPSVSPPKLAVANKRNKVQIQFESPPVQQQSPSAFTGTPPPLSTAEDVPGEDCPPPLSPCSEEPSEEAAPEEVKPVEEPQLDPLLREEDQDKRLRILIQELADKLLEMQQSLSPITSTTTSQLESDNGAPLPQPPEPQKYEIVVNYSLDRRSDDSILNDMLAKTSVDCPYCRLVRLIRIDKRQLVIHMLSRHLWDLQVRASSVEVLKAVLETPSEGMPPKQEPNSPNNEECNDSHTKPTSTADSPNVAADKPSEDLDRQKEQTGGELQIKSEPDDDELKESTLKNVEFPVSSSHTVPMKVDGGKPQPAEDELPKPSIFEPPEPSENHVDESDELSLLEPVVAPPLKAPIPSLFDPPELSESKLAEPSIFDPPAPETDSLSADPTPAESSTQLPNSTSDKLALNGESQIEKLLQENSQLDTSGDQSASAVSLEEKSVDESKATLLLCDQKPETESSLISADLSAVKTENGVEPSMADDYEMVPWDLTWSSFRIALLVKVFHSNNVVYTFTGEKLGQFGDKPCECLLCGFIAESQKSLFPHWRKTHRGIAMKCTMCKGRFLFAGALYSHLCLGTSEPLTLTEKEVDDDDDGNNETVGLRYQCGICENVQLPGFFNYMVHLRKDHNRCELCLEEVQNQKELEYHVKKHKLNHFCWKCNLSYCAKPNLMTHLFWKHGTESVDCSKCLKKKWPHIYHFCLPPEYFVCEVCGLYFTRPTALRVHSRLHTGEKLRKCPKTSCQERFISKKLLQKHLETVHAKIPPPQVMAAPPNVVKTEEPDATETSAATATAEIPSVKVNGESSKHGDEEPAGQSGITPVEPESDEKVQPTSELNDGDGRISPSLETKAPDAPAEGDKIEDITGGGLQNGILSPSPPLTPAEEAAEGGSSESGRTGEEVAPEPQGSPASEISRPIETEKIGNHVTSPKEVLTESPRRSKPFNLSKIQGPNLSESESDSEEVEPVKAVSPSLDAASGSIKENGELDGDSGAYVNGKMDTETPPPSVSSSAVTEFPSTTPMNVDDDESVKSSSIANEIEGGSRPVGDDSLSGSKMDVDDDHSFASSSLPKISLDMTEPVPNLLDGAVEKSKSGDEFSSMSPLLLPLDDFDFSVPEIPTFEENHLPEHIIQENALFSIQHEHDYCSPNFSGGNFKRKSASPAAYGYNNSLNSGRSDVNDSPSRGRPKKSKVGKISPKKAASRKRSRSSSSSSSSSSSCSSCGSNCSCSSSSSGSSSSSSSSSDSDSESSEIEESRKVKKSPKRVNKIKIKSIASPSPKKAGKKTGEHTETVSNGKLKPEKIPKPRGRKRKIPKTVDKRQAEPKEQMAPAKQEPEPEPEPFILETDLDTDDSGSEEVFHKKQLTEMIGASKPPTDEVWTMSSEKFLLKLVRGVDVLEELRPPPPPPPPPPQKVGKKDRFKYTVKSNGTPEPRLKVRNVPIKPLIVKRNTHYADGNLAGVSKVNSVFLSRGYNNSPNNAVGFNSKMVDSDSSVLSTPPTPRTKSTPRARANQLKAKSFKGEAFSPFIGHPDTTGGDVQSPATKRRASRGRKSGAKADKVSKKASNEAYVDERLYCICQSPHDNVSQMIGCDSKDCQYKWFHFECVDIVIPPPGKWFCQDCREVRRKKAVARAAAHKEKQLQNDNE